MCERQGGSLDYLLTVERLTQVGVDGNLELISVSLAVSLELSHLVHLESPPLVHLYMCMHVHM